MAILAPIPIREKLRQKAAARRSRKKEKVARGVKEDRTVRAKYNKDLQQIANELIKQTKNELIESLRKTESEYIQDSYADVLGGILESMANRWLNITSHAKLVAGEMVGGINEKNRKRFYKALEGATGVNLNGIISEEGLQPMLTTKVNENVSLIKSIPDEFFKKLNIIVAEGTSRGKSSGGIVKDILDLGKSTKKRA